MLTCRIPRTCRQVSSDFDFEIVRGQFERIRAHTLRHQDLPSSSATTVYGGDLIQRGVLGVRRMLSPETISRSVINSRNLQQSACADGTTSFAVSSTVFPLMEGCFVAVDVEGTTVYATDTAVIFPAEAPIATDVSSSGQTQIMYPRGIHKSEPYVRRLVASGAFFVLPRAQ